MRTGCADMVVCAFTSVSRERMRRRMCLRYGGETHMPGQCSLYDVDRMLWCVNEKRADVVRIGHLPLCGRITLDGRCPLLSHA